MTDSEIRIAIAEACGHERTDQWRSGWMKRTPEWPNGLPGELPDYPNDLNAMHEAEKTLAYHQANYYSQVALPKITKGELVNAQVFATARQRAEAFLRTIRKWKE